MKLTTVARYHRQQHHPQVTVNHLIFISATAPRTQAVSDFKQYGLTNEVATPAREVAIVPIVCPVVLQATLLISFISSLVQATLLKIAMPMDGQVYESILRAISSSKLILTAPEIVVSFAGMELKDNIAALVASFNFRESIGHRTYYCGTPSIFFTGGCRR